MCLKNYINRCQDHIDTHSRENFDHPFNVRLRSSIFRTRSSIGQIVLRLDGTYLEDLYTKDRNKSHGPLPRPCATGNVCE